MRTYLILQNPGHNRVYYNNSINLALAELKLTCFRFENRCENITDYNLCNVRYLKFDYPQALTPSDLLLLSRLSFVFTLFELTEIESKVALLPIEKSNYEYVDSKISSLLKYSGKTNELFTKMMINVAMLVSDYPSDLAFNMLDPVAGKGTTMFEGLILGHDVYGVEIEQKSVHEANIFFKKYLETERYKHDFEKRHIAGKSKADATYIHEYEFARSKDEFQNEQLRKTFALVNGSTEQVDQYFKKNSFHIIVGDLPYGIAHGNSRGKKNASITRNPSELLAHALPAWHNVLRKGGSVVVAWNSYVASKDDLTGIFEASGFTVLKEEPFSSFEHLVDKSIKRDLIVAKKED